MSNLYDIGKAGLQSYRQSLAITGQNIANINTDGYKRRGAELEEMSATKASALEISQGKGMGVRVGVIRRAFDEFLLNKARSATSYAESTAAFVNAASQLENILLPGEANLGNAIGRFFEGMQEVSSDPADLTGRTVAIEQAKQVADSFVQLAGLMEEMKGGLNVQAGHLVDEVNLLTAEIKRINQQLSGGSQSKPNNSLLDSRDNLIDKLNEYIQVHVTLNDRGAALITLGDNPNGPELVTTEKVVDIGVEQHSTKLLFKLDPNNENILTNKIVGGSVHGLSSAYRTAVEVLEEVDRIAFTLVRDVNAIHRRGLTLEGESGGDFFSSLKLSIDPSGANTGTASAELRVVDPDEISSAKVTFSYDADAKIWRGVSDNGTAIVSGRNTVMFGGVEISFRGQPNQFDQFVYNPVGGSAGGVALALRRPEDIAAASQHVVSADPNNKNQVLVDARSVSTDKAPSLPTIEDTFGNGVSAIAATEFLNGGAVASIPADVSNIDILSLAKQSQVQFGLSETDLQNASTLSVGLKSVDSNGTVVTDTLSFDVGFLSVKGFSGNWQDTEQIADLLNRGIIKGALASDPNTPITLTDAGAFASGSGGFLNLSHRKADFTSGTISKSTGGTAEGVVSERVSDASEIQIFTTEGRHLAGTVPSNDAVVQYQAAMTAENGFNTSAVYVGDYLNQSGDDGYLGMSVKTFDQSNLLVGSASDGSSVSVDFALLDGVDTNETSVNGQSSVSQSIDYSLSIGGLSASVAASDINEPSGVAVATSMIEKLRADAPLAYKVGAAATPADTDILLVSFEGQTYKIEFDNGDARVSGGEPDRLTAFFDSRERLHVVSTAGTVGKSNIDVVLSDDHPDNVDVAQRLGFLDGLSQMVTRYSDESLVVEGTGSAGDENKITLTFSADDTYNLRFVFDEKPDNGVTAATDRDIKVSAAMSAGDATAIATAINNALAANAADGDGGADLSGAATATSVGGVVTLTIEDGTGVEIFRDGNTISTGSGTVTINPVTMGGSQKTLADAYTGAGSGFDLIRDGSKIIADSTAFFSKTFTVDSAELTVGDVIEVNNVDITLVATTISDLVDQLNAAKHSTGVTAAQNGNDITLFARDLQEITVGYKTKQEIESTFNAATTLNIAAGANAAADVDVVLNSNDVVVGRTYALALGSGSSTIGAKTVTYTAQTGDDSQAIMQGLRDALRAADARFDGVAAQTLDADTIPGTLTIADDLNYGDAAISFGIDAASINNALGEAGTYALEAGQTSATASFTADSLAQRRLILSDLPDEELIIFVDDSGAKRLTMQYDEIISPADQIGRDLEIKVKDAEANIIEVFDTETGTSMATRSLDADGKTKVLGFELVFEGVFDAEDRFNIASNKLGTGDNRNLQHILDLQSADLGEGFSGGFQKMYNNEVSRLGAIVQSGKIASEAATALKEASIEAEASYSGVNLDTEAANLIQQQQAYQASARILSTARELFDTLLQVV